MYGGHNNQVDPSDFEGIGPDGTLEPVEFDDLELEEVELRQRKAKIVAGTLLGVLGFLVLAIVGALIAFSNPTDAADDSSPSPDVYASPETNPSPEPSASPTLGPSPLANPPVAPSPTQTAELPRDRPSPTATASAAPTQTAPPTSAPTMIPAPVAGDDLDDPIVIDMLPFTHSLDSTNATSGSSDPDCDGGGPTVWFSYRPSAATTVGVTTEGSHFYTTIAFGTLTKSGGFKLVDCRYGSLRFDAKAGTTYLFMVADEEYAKGGMLVFSLASVPPAPEISLSIDPAGTFDAQGRALISGTVSCTTRVDDLEIYIAVRQKYDRFIFEGWGEVIIGRCKPATTSWTALANSYNGTFGEGTASVTASSYAYDGFGSSEASTTANVALQSDVPPIPSPNPVPAPTAEVSDPEVSSGD